MRLTAVTTLDGFTVRVRLDDGTTRDLDLTRYVSTGPIFEPVRTDPAIFRQVHVDPIDHTLTWPNGANIDTLVLLGEREPVSNALL